MSKSILIVLIFGLVLCAGLIAGLRMQKNTPQAETAPEMEASDNAPEKTVLVVFDGEDRSQLAGLRVWAADGTEFTPVRSEETGDPAFGIYRLSPGDYVFSFREEGKAGSALEKVAFTICEGISEALVTPEETPDIFAVETGSGVFVNPVYKNVVSEDSVTEMSQAQKSVEESARDLMKFRDVVRAAGD